MTTNVTHFLLKHFGCISQPYQSFMSMKRFCDCYKWTMCYNFSYNYNLYLNHTSHWAFVLLLITTLPTSTDSVLLTCVLWLQHKGVRKETDQIPDIHWDCNKNNSTFHQTRLSITVSHSPMPISGMWLNPLQSHFLYIHLPVSRFGMFGTKRTVFYDSSLGYNLWILPASLKSWKRLSRSPVTRKMWQRWVQRKLNTVFSCMRTWLSL